MADREFTISGLSSAGPLEGLARAMGRLAPDWMTLASLRVTMHGSELSKAELIVPEKSPPAPVVTAELESALRAYIRNDWERVRGYGEEWYLDFVLDRDARECIVEGPTQTTPDFHFDCYGPPKRAPRGAYKYKPPPRARKAKKQPPSEAGS